MGQWGSEGPGSEGLGAGGLGRGALGNGGAAVGVCRVRFRARSAGLVGLLGKIRDARQAGRSKVNDVSVLH